MEWVWMWVWSGCGCGCGCGWGCGCGLHSSMWDTFGYYVTASVHVMVLMFCLSEITPMSATNHQCTVPLTQCLSKLLTFSSQSASKIKEDNNRVALQETESCSLVLRLSQLSLHACNFSTLTQHRWKTLDPLFCFSPPVVFSTVVPYVVLVQYTVSMEPSVILAPKKASTGIDLVPTYQLLWNPDLWPF